MLSASRHGKTAAQSHWDVLFFSLPMACVGKDLSYLPFYLPGTVSLHEASHCLLMQKVVGVRAGLPLSAFLVLKTIQAEAELMVGWHKHG